MIRRAMQHLLWSTALFIGSVVLAASQNDTRLASSSPINGWAFQPLRSTRLPEVHHNRWVQTDVDRFILSRLEREHLTPSPRASKLVLLRRVYFDLIGLPPTPAEIDAFLHDTSSHAFEDVMERLLASERYGERWGQHWLDLVRYADTAGDNADYPVPEASRYRDYVIDSFNRDKPYDVFLREQLAGDILAARDLAAGKTNRYAEQIIATGFLALSRRYATAPFELMHLTLEDTIDTTSRTFLGLSFRCARCHDHKFDPITKRDYYGMYGIFASTRFPYAGSEEFQSKNLPRTGFVPLLPPSLAAGPLQTNQARLEALREELTRWDKAVAAEKTNSAQRKTLESQITTLRKELKRRERSGAMPNLPVAYAVAEDKPLDASIQEKGDPDQKGPIVQRCLPAFLAGDAPLKLETGSSGRLEWANWMAAPEHPLTSRVLVNRVWQHHFGRGLVPTPSNFGMRGETPSHPELLDYLAQYFNTHGRSIKALHRLILSSATWQQSSDPNPRTEAVDPENQWCGRFEAQRLEAEPLRDALLSVSGSLILERPGPHEFPPVEDWHWTQHNPFKAIYDHSYRSVYLMRQRIQRHPYLSLFDAPDANVSTDIRTRATVPLQALYFMNSTFLETQSRQFGARLEALHWPLHRALDFAAASAWGRKLTASERKEAEAYWNRYRAIAKDHGVSEDQSRLEAWTSYARVLMTSNEFLYVD